MKKKLLVVIPGFIPTVEIIMRTLNYMRAHYQVKVVLSSNVCINEIFSGEYILLFIRICDPAFKSILNSMRKHRVHYFYYLDDNFWEIGKGSTLLAQSYSYPPLVKTLNSFIRGASVVIAGSENLKQYIIPKNKNTISMKAAFDFEILHDLNKEPKDNKIRILYSGSLYRGSDFIIIIPALKKILEEFIEDVVIYFNGFVPNELKSYSNVEYDEHFYSYEHYIKKQYQIQYDIGLAPLHDSLSSRAKSNLKYREYSACGIAGIYSNIPPYSDCIIHEENGYLVEHTENAWYAGLKELILNKTLRNMIVKNALDDVVENYNQEKISEFWNNILETAPPASINKAFSFIKCFILKGKFKYISFIYKIKRVQCYYQSHGLIFTYSKIMRALCIRQQS